MHFFSHAKCSAASGQSMGHLQRLLCAALCRRPPSVRCRSKWTQQSSELTFDDIVRRVDDVLEECLPKVLKRVRVATSIAATRPGYRSAWDPVMRDALWMIELSVLSGSASFHPEEVFKDLLALRNAHFGPSAKTTRGGMHFLSLEASSPAAAAALTNSDDVPTLVSSLRAYGMSQRDGAVRRVIAEVVANVLFVAAPLPLPAGQRRSFGTALRALLGPTSDSLCHVGSMSSEMLHTLARLRIAQHVLRRSDFVDRDEHEIRVLLYLVTMSLDATGPAGPRDETLDAVRALASRMVSDRTLVDRFLARASAGLATCGPSDALRCRRRVRGDRCNEGDKVKEEGKDADADEDADEDEDEELGCCPICLDELGQEGCVRMYVLECFRTHVVCADCWEKMPDADDSSSGKTCPQCRKVSNVESVRKPRPPSSCST